MRVRRGRGCVSSPLELTVEGEKGRERKGGREIEREDTRADDERARASATDILIFTHTYTCRKRKGGKNEERRIHVRFTLSRVA